MQQLERKLPIKPHLENIRELINGMRKELGDSSKVMEEITEDLLVSEFKIQDPFRDLLEYCRVQTQKMQGLFERESLTFEEQMSFLRGQTEEIEEDKIRINQHLIIIGSKLEEIEKDIGYD